MNGMKAKKIRRERAKLFDENRLPRNPNDWTEDDWRDLHEAMEQVKENISKRHKERSE